jgi:hypothetical protein
MFAFNIDELRVSRRRTQEDGGGSGLGTDAGSSFASALRRASSRGARGKGSSASALRAAASSAWRSSSVRLSMRGAYTREGRPVARAAHIRH